MADVQLPGAAAPSQLSVDDLEAERDRQRAHTQVLVPLATTCEASRRHITELSLDCEGYMWFPTWLRSDVLRSLLSLLSALTTLHLRLLPPHFPDMAAFEADRQLPGPIALLPNLTKLNISGLEWLIPYHGQGPDTSAWFFSGADLGRLTSLVVSAYDRGFREEPAEAPSSDAAHYPEIALLLPRLTGLKLLSLDASLDAAFSPTDAAQILAALPPSLETLMMQPVWPAALRYTCFWLLCRLHGGKLQSVELVLTGPDHELYVVQRAVRLPVRHAARLPRLGPCLPRLAVYMKVTAARAPGPLDRGAELLARCDEVYLSNLQVDGWREAEEGEEVDAGQQAMWAQPVEVGGLEAIEVAMGVAQQFGVPGVLRLSHLDHELQLLTKRERRALEVVGVGSGSDSEGDAVEEGEGAGGEGPDGGGACSSGRTVSSSGSASPPPSPVSLDQLLRRAVGRMAAASEPGAKPNPMRRSLLLRGPAVEGLLAEPAGRLQSWVEQLAEDMTEAQGPSPEYSRARVHS
ncbi:hypothetical protein HYH03_015275 [Edaphochlamys debaryana]|uniref:Uncharacterized protein n=1 Tax=Edaphochlamys debaryana TaxID=47281 RepID=A0A836BSQ3_9CHLO|nr:hypothetical protein HYH03_015275 [Edaphochlamys debaryana]|eukprot:KAG2486069.1 hypothetical protein HYH03_015275 [Edaphochlamys debaryana]